MRTFDDSLRVYVCVVQAQYYKSVETIARLLKIDLRTHLDDFHETKWGAPSIGIYYLRFEDIVGKISLLNIDIRMGWVAIRKCHLFAVLMGKWRPIYDECITTPRAVNFK